MEEIKIDEQDLDQNFSKINNVFLLFLSQIKAMIYKTAEVSKRRLLYFGCQFIAPVLVLLLGLTAGFLLATFSNFDFTPPSVEPRMSSQVPFDYSFKDSRYKYAKLLIAHSGEPSFVGNLNKFNSNLTNGIFSDLKSKQYLDKLMNETAYYPYGIQFKDTNHFDIDFIKNQQKMKCKK